MKNKQNMMKWAKAFSQGLVLTATLMVGSNSWAKVSDFNNLINENIKAQDNLHNDVKVNMDIARQNLREKLSQGKVTVVQSEVSNYNAPSKKMRFRKEVYQHRPSIQKQMNRVAAELNEAERDF